MPVDAGRAWPRLRMSSRDKAKGARLFVSRAPYRMPPRLVARIYPRCLRAGGEESASGPDCLANGRCLPVRSIAA